MSEFQYRGLDHTKASIRLLRIEKGWWFDDISCSLFETFLNADQVSTYKALSYAWGGGSKDKHQILVNNQSFMVKDNLFSALRHIRHTDQDVLLWVDAVCINQKNDQEKGHQVKQMGRVYSTAEEVLIWLGTGNEDTLELMQSVNWIDINAKKAQTGANGQHWTDLCRRFMAERLGNPESQLHSKQRSVLAELLKNGWFKRVWILQEVAMAKTARILCGYYSCPARTFSFMPYLMGLDVDEHSQAVLDIMPQLRKNTWWSSRRYLHYLLTKFAGSQATKERDKVYALLSMSEDANDPTRFFPCYVKDESLVWRDTVSFLIFGEILDLNHSFPEFTLPELRLPIIQLAEQALTWALNQVEPLQESARTMAMLLVDRLNEGQLKRHELLMSLAEKHGQVGNIRKLLFHDNYHIGIDFEGDQAILRVTSTELAQQTVSMVFPQSKSANAEEQQEDKPPSFRFKDDENMAETIVRLVEEGSSMQEMLWAHTWAGNRDAVQNLLEEGADANGADDQGHTALHFATFRGHLDIVNLLLAKDADVNSVSAEGNSALSFAILGLRARD
ncbi:HET domain-containing protein [Fusarium sp. LHS14.1]|nr:HET domain-containing protein [Fusarium sp. LHS14.1]